MPKLPPSKKRPWIPTRARDNKGVAPTPRSASEFISFYGSKRWKSLRRYYMQMNPLCEECDRLGFTTPGECVDHITPMRWGGDKTSLNNLQTLCNLCHSVKSGKESQIKNKTNV